MQQLQRHTTLNGVEGPGHFVMFVIQFVFCLYLAATSMEPWRTDFR